MKPIIPMERIAAKIHLVRGSKIMLDRDLAELYQVETRALKQAVRRNSARFPEDFMFEISPEEFNTLRSHLVTSSWGGLRHMPMAFTEQGVAMLSSVLHSERAIRVNIEIMRAFTELRRMLAGHEDLRLKIEELEQRYDEQFRAVFEAIKGLVEVEATPQRKIGFTEGVDWQ